ncbi:MAG: dihydroorotate dehydrogenase electron transfer subunit [bacterium]
MTAKIIENYRISSYYYRLTLDCAEIAQKAAPGQFVMIRVNHEVEPLLRRPFSIHRQWTSSSHRSAQAEGIQILFRIVGKGTAHLASLSRGAKIDIIGPLGQGFRLKTAISHPLLIAGGIGAAPLLFLADRIEEAQALPLQPRLFLGGKTKEDILCREDFEKDGFSLHISTEDGSMGHKGLIMEPFSDYLKQAMLSGKNEITIFACGPLPLMYKVAEAARQYNLSCQVSLEQKMACGVGACLGCVIEWADADNPSRYRRVCKEGPVFEAGRRCEARRQEL